MKAVIKGILVGVQIILVLLIMRELTETGYAAYDGEPVDVDFYVMSQCPYGLQVENEIAPVLDKFGDAVNFQLDYIARETSDGFASLHGQPEVDGNIIQLCAAEYYPDTYMDMVICMNKDARNIPDNWEKCSVGDKEVLRECYEGEEGKELLKESIKRANEADATGSPTMHFNGELYQGGRDEISFTREICSYLDDHPECEKIPECSEASDCQKEGMNGFCREGNCVYEEPKDVSLTIINDENCASCDTTQIVQVLTQMFKGAEIEYVDVSEDNELIETIDVVPAFIFDDRITETLTWKTNDKLHAAFEEKDGMYKIKDDATGASYVFDEEKREEIMKEIDVDINDGIPQVDFFIMSYCPYGNQADEIIAEVSNVLGEKAEYIPRYVIYENYQGGGEDYCLTPEICSMHGIQELNQNIREKCVYEDEGWDAWAEFALNMNELCNARNADTCWKNVAVDLGLDTDKISKCEEERGLELMNEDKRIQKILGVSGSPTIFIEGNQYSGQRDANSILGAMCSEYENAPSECNKVITETTTAPTGNCG